MIEALTWALDLDPATLKWPAAVLVAVCFGLVLFGLVQYQAFNRLWGIQLVLGLAGGAVVAGLGAATHWLLGVLYGLGYVLTWLVWVLTRRLSGWRQHLLRGLTAGLALGPWLWLGATEKEMLVGLASRGTASASAEWLLAPTGLIWFWMTLGALWLLVLVGGWGCWRAAMPDPRRGWRRRMLVAAWAVLGVLGLNWYAAGRVDLFAACKEGRVARLGYVLVSRPGSQWYRYQYGQTPLHLAAAYGRFEALRVLLNAGADANAKDNGGETPLHWAASVGHAEAIRSLLAAGARVNARRVKGETALDVAKDDECRQLLRQAGGKTGAELDAEKATPAPEPAPPEPGR